ncbi:MAG: aminotransferase class V-fold PLP-dependent enzyme [Bacteroidota bacterium]
MTDWNRIRSFFPACRKFTYLNPAGGSPVSIQAASAAKNYYDEMLHEGDTLYDLWLERKEKVRTTLARFINASPDEVAFTLNTSHGMNLVAGMIDTSGEILTMHDEFPSTTFPWIHKGVKMKHVMPVDNGYPLENIENAISNHTRALVSSHVQYNTGFRQDAVALGQLCRKYKLIHVLNITQSIGAMPIDARKFEADFMVFTGLKWPMAGYGIGGIYINKEIQENVKFPVAGWQSVELPEEMNNRTMKLQKRAAVLEPGCPHFGNIFALGAALELLDEIGSKNIQERIMELNRYLVKKLQGLKAEIITPLDEKHRSGITVTRHSNAKTIVEKLASRKIIVSARGEGIRISLHIYNNEEDIDCFIKELKRIY